MPSLCIFPKSQAYNTGRRGKRKVVSNNKKTIHRVLIGWEIKGDILKWKKLAFV